jgi:hypothetical protein
MAMPRTRDLIPHHSGSLELPVATLVASALEPEREVVTLPEPARKERPAWVEESLEISREEVAIEAYCLFEARGFEHGHDVEDWLAAEAIVRQRRLAGS